MLIILRKHCHFLRKEKAFLFLLLFMFIFTQCIVVKEEEKFFFKKDNNKVDTIPPFGPLMVAFSEEILDTIMPQFQFSPSFYSFTISSNKQNDTFYIRFIEPLDGEKRYVIRTAQTLYSKGGAIMYPGDDSLEFITLPLELEPNNDFTLADTLKDEKSGTLSNISDIDCYIIPNNIKKLVISPKECIVTYYIYNCEKKVIFISEEITNSDTIPLTQEDSAPYYVILKPVLKVVAGYYIIKTIS